MANRNRVKDHGAAHGLYARVPNALARDYELSNMARSVALEVWSHAAEWEQSMKEIATRLKTGRRQVSNAFTELQARGWLVREVVKVDRIGHPAVEVWHRNMTNEPFSARQVDALQGAPCSPEEQVTTPWAQVPCAPEAQVPCAPEAQHSSETSSETTSEKNLRPRGTGPREALSRYSPRGEAHILPANTAEEQTQKGSAMKAEENLPTCAPEEQGTCASRTPPPRPWEDAPFGPPLSPSGQAQSEPPPNPTQGFIDPFADGYRPDLSPAHTPRPVDTGDPADPFSSVFVPEAARP